MNGHDNAETEYGVRWIESGVAEVRPKEEALLMAQKWPDVIEVVTRPVGEWDRLHSDSPGGDS